MRNNKDGIAAVDEEGHLTGKLNVMHRGNMCRMRDHKLIGNKCMIFIWIFFICNMYILYNLEPIKYLYSPEARNPPEEGVMTALSIGRLGNNMWEYATLLSLSRLNRCSALLSPMMSDYLKPCFRVTTPTNWTLDRYANWRTEPIPHLLVNKQRNVSCHGSFVRLTGYPSDWRYFAGFENLVRQEFTFVPEVHAEAAAFLRAVSRERPQPVTFVGVHVRRSDYGIYLERQDCVLADKRYLLKAMKHFHEKYRKVLFIVASDSTEEVQEMLADIDFPMVLVDSRYSSCTSMAILSQCNHSIITQGTFGFWAAYLARGETVYFTDYCLGNTEVLPKFRGLHLDNWIGISASKL